jgi:hypothetical protein
MSGVQDKCSEFFEANLFTPKVRSAKRQYEMENEKERKNKKISALRRLLISRQKPKGVLERLAPGLGSIGSLVNKPFLGGRKAL